MKACPACGLEFASMASLERHIGQSLRCAEQLIVAARIRDPRKHHG